MKESNDLDKTIKVEVTNTNATVEKGFETIGKIFKRKKKREEPVESQENVACNSQKGLGWASLGGGLAGLSIMLGAFGAHSLKARLTEKKLATFHTATDYLGYHALGLILIGILIYLLHRDTARKLNRSAIWISVGMVFFCGSLYGLVFDGPRFLGPITPLGGLCFMIGWFTATAALFKTSNG
jgi:uncharacterized membrane protein YgdD (TMEM256/DUF423 family)